jgi:hypothetical protein
MTFTYLQTMTLLKGHLIPQVTFSFLIFYYLNTKCEKPAIINQSVSDSIFENESESRNYLT